MISYIVTICGIGRSKFAPGTFGSLVAFPLFFLFAILALKLNIYLKLDIALVISVVNILASVVIFFVGWWASILYINENYSNDPEHDPSEIVIDEVAGQLFTLGATVMPSFMMITNINIPEWLLLYINIDIFTILICLLLPFLLFRFFDIAKPWPIRDIENRFPNAFGVMIDDIFAALLAILFHYSFLFTLI